MVYRPYNPAARFSNPSIVPKRVVEENDPEPAPVSSELDRILNQPGPEPVPEQNPSPTVDQIMAPLPDPDPQSPVVQGPPTPEQVGSSGTPYETVQGLMDRYLNRSPNVIPPPQQPKPTVKGALKEFLTNMIPGYSDLKERKLASEEQARQESNSVAVKQYQEQNDILRPMLVKAYDVEMQAKEAANKYRFMVETMHIPPEQARYYAQGFTPPVARIKPESQKYHLKLPDHSEIEAYSQDDGSGAPQFYTLDGKPIPPDLLGQSEIFSISARPQDQRDTTDMRKQEHAELLFEQKHPKPADPHAVKLWAAQARDEYDRAHMPPTPYSFVPGAEQPTLIDPRNPARPGIQATGPDGKPIQPKRAEIPAAMKVQANAAWTSLQQADNAEKIIKANQDLVGPIAGNFEAFMIGKGIIPGLSPAKQQMAAQLAAHLNYLFAQELRTMFPGRTNETMQQLIKSTSAQLHQNPAILSGLLDAVRYNANTVLQSPALSGWAPVGAMQNKFSGLTDDEVFDLGMKGDREAKYEYVKRVKK